MEKRDQLKQIYLGGEPAKDISDGIEMLYNYLKTASNFTNYVYFKPSFPYPKVYHFNYSRYVSEGPTEPFSHTLRHRPDEFLGALKVALHQVVLDKFPQADFSPIQVSISRYDVVTPMDSIRSAQINKFACVTGNVTKITSKRAHAQSMDFVCLKCKSFTKVEFLEGKYELPKKCSNSECLNTRAFTPLRESAECVDRQRIKVQESSTIDQGKVPLSLDCEAWGLNLSDICIGDSVTVMGIVRPEISNQTKFKHTGLYGLYLEIVSIYAANDAEHQDEYSPNEINHIEELSKTKNIFHVLVNNMCNLIYGHEKVKAGLLLSLLGGSDLDSRDTVHVLVVGDPGIGKTQLIRAAVNLSSKGTYISATTKSGLTVGMTRENGQQTMQAGALLMADGGVCAIDEFDKLGKDQEAVCEVMEQQTISIAKTGLYSSFPAKTTIIAATNPKEGNYNQGKSIQDNLKINTAVLDRFDLIFLLLDQHVEDIAKHVLDLRIGQKRNYSQAFADPIEAYIKKSCSQYSCTQRANDSINENETFTEFMKRVCQTTSMELPPETIKKYLSYAKKHCKPKLSNEAIELIQEFYMFLRKDSSCSYLAVSTRQLESLKRLTEARAKAELRDLATPHDAIEVIKLYQETIFELQVKESFNFQQNKKGKTNSKTLGEMSLPKQREAFKERLREETEDLISFPRLREVAKELGLKVGDFSDFIEGLNMQGFFIKKPGGFYKVIQ